MTTAQIQAITMRGQQADTSRLLRKFAGVLIRAVLIFSIIVVSFTFASSSLPALLGFKTMVVFGGSMVPAIQVGDAVIVRPAPLKSIQIGDVITFTGFGSKGMITHRVMAIKEIQGRTYLQTKGDANNTADPNLTPVDAIYGEVVYTLPKVGYLQHFSITVTGKMLMIGVPLLILMAQEIWGLLQMRKRPRLPQQPQRLDEAEPHAASK